MVVLSDSLTSEKEYNQMVVLSDNISHLVIYKDL